MFNVVVHTPDVVGDRMAGPGIRAWHLSRELARHFATTLIAKCEGIAPEDVPVIEHNTDAARAAMRDATVLVGQPARGFRKRRPGQRMVFDLFDPTVLELRELYGNEPSLRQRVHLAAEWWRLSEALMRGDLLMCAARRQRDFYEKLQSGSASWIEVPFGVDPADEFRDVRRGEVRVAGILPLGAVREEKVRAAGEARRRAPRKRPRGPVSQPHAARTTLQD